MKPIKKITGAWGSINRIHDVGNTIAAAILVCMCLTICYEVTMRYFFRAPTVWGLDISEFCMVAASFIGASYVLIRRRHVRVEAFVNLMPPVGRLILEILGSLIMLNYSIVLTWQGWEQAMRSFTLDWRTPDLAHLPLWPAQIIIPLSAVLLCFAVIWNLYFYIKTWRTEDK